MKKIFSLLLIMFVMFLGITTVYAEGETAEPAKEKTCDITVYFKEKDTDGNSVKSGNPLPTRHNVLSVGNSWSTASQALAKNLYPTWSQNGTIYEFVEWQDEDGNAVPESMYYTAGDPSRLRIKFPACSEEDPDVTVKTYYIVWKAKKAPIIIFNNIDNVANGSHSASNSDAVASAYTHTFKVPADVPADYSFLYWKIDEYKYCDGGTCTESDVYNGVYGDYNTTQTVNAYAWYQPGVKVNYYNEDKTSFKAGEWSFEDVQLISEKPEKPGYDFVGWFDEDGNEVTKTTFEVPEITTEPNKAVTYNLYAKFERTTMEVTINKVWDDNDNEKEKRTNSVNVSITLDDEEVESVEIKENDNKKWTTSVTLYKYDTQGNELNYTFKEDKVDFYTVSVSDLVDNVVTITNTIYGTGNVVVKYIDIDTNKELDSTTLSGLYTESYTTELKDFEGYELVSIVGETSGEFGDKDLEVIYYYTSNYGDEGEREDVITPPHTDAVDSFGEQIVYLDDRKYKNRKA